MTLRNCDLPLYPFRKFGQQGGLWGVGGGGGGRDKKSNGPQLDLNNTLLQSNFSTMVSLGVEESSHYREVTCFLGGYTILTYNYSKQAYCTNIFNKCA